MMRKSLETLSLVWCRQWELTTFHRTCLRNGWLLVARWGYIHIDMSHRIPVVSGFIEWWLLCE